MTYKRENDVIVYAKIRKKYIEENFVILDLIFEQIEFENLSSIFEHGTK